MSIRSKGRVAVAVVVAVLATLAPAGVGFNAAGAQTPGGIGVWETTDSLSVPRYDHTTTLLATGDVLAAGGRRVVGEEPVTHLQSAELYNPRTETWSPTGSLADARRSHTATLLQDGTLLVVGGFGDPYSSANAQPVLGSAEIYDPETGTWSPTGSLNTRRALHTATLLVDGRVLVTGGRTCDQPPPVACNFTFRTDSAEIYDPATGTWSPTGPLSIPRHTTSAVVLDTGEVLIPAGFTPVGNGTTADRYDAAATASTVTGPLNVGRARSGAMLLDNGQVLVAAGFGGGATSELYDPETDTWTLTGNVATSGRFNYFYTVLPDGRALIAGGAVPGVGAVATAEIYDPATGTWSPADDMNEAHGSSSSLSNSQQAIVLSSDPWTFEADPAVCGTNCGKVLVVGNSVTGSAELFDPAISLEITDTVSSDGTRGQVTGSVTCPAGELFLVEVELTQGEATGLGTARGTCTGSPQEYTANFTTGGGAQLSDGSAEACVTLNSAPRRARTTNHQAEVCEEVTVQLHQG